MSKKLWWAARTFALCSQKSAGGSVCCGFLWAEIFRKDSEEAPTWYPYC